MTADARELAAIFVGGAVGTTARAGLASSWAAEPTHWPWATFAANIAGALLLGLVATYLKERSSPSRHWYPLLGTGLCGGLTTFSTMQVEIVGMVDGGAYALAAAYTSASLVAGLLAVHVATTAVRRVGGRR